ncbi:MAG: hypothetical protein ACXAD7_02575 [Candidatus Kariarchaeaceae archaeon]
MSSENNPSNTNNPYDVTNTSAFGTFNSVATSFTGGLEHSIIELAKSSDELLMSDVLDRFGNYPQVHTQIKKLLLENKLVMYELENDSIQAKNFEAQVLKLVNPNLSSWIDLAAQPCLTCSIFNECAIENPVSPSSCIEFEAWLQEEIELETDYNH